jgi:sugar lactone lactonase YvrE
MKNSDNTTSKSRDTARASLLAAAAALMLFVSACSSPGGDKDISKALPKPIAGECVPGAECSGGASSGGPDEYSFWIKDRRAAAPSGSAAFYESTAEKIAVSPHYTVYREKAGASLMTNADAEALLDSLEGSYDMLKEIYGADTAPDIHNSGRIVILAVDIKDDYKIENPAYIGGFAAPRDLFANSFTSQLFENPELIEDYPSLALIEAPSNLAGPSNENQIIYMDLHPFYDGTALGGDEAARIKSRKLFAEAVLHEASHLFIYNRRVITGLLPNLYVAVNEGLAEQAPRIIGSHTEAQTERMNQLALPLIQSHLTSGSASLISLGSSGNAIAGYCQVNLFFNYLRHRAGIRQKELIRAIVTGTDPSPAGLEQALSSAVLSTTAGLFEDWVLSTWLSASGKNLTAYTGSDGTAVDPGDGNYPSKKYNLSYRGVGIAAAGATGLAFKSGSLPLCYESMTTIAPASFLYFTYTITGTETAYIPVNKGMNAGLRVAVARLSGTNDASLRIYTPLSTIPLNTFTPGEVCHFIIYNSSLSGQPLATGQLPWDTRNLASWLGGGKSGWQTGSGAVWSRSDAYFYRPTGLAVSTVSANGGDADYIYTADSINHGVSRWNLKTGLFAGRIGSKITESASPDCSADSTLNDGWKFSEGSLAINYCRRSFNAPQGVAVDSQGFIYVADTNNHRIVKWDRDGNAIAWLGHPTDETWQTADKAGPIKPFDLTGRETDVRMFSSPWGLAVDESGSTPYLYISCWSSSRISRRNLITGTHEGFIGNGKTGWNTEETIVSGQWGSGADYFRNPTGISLDEEYIYIADTYNHRIARWSLISGEPASGASWIGGGTGGWHGLPIEIDNTLDKGCFKYPGGVYADNTYIYVADTKNQRIVRREKSTGIFAGWIGGGATEWELELNGPIQTPVVIGGATYPALFMLEPLFITGASSSESGLLHDYLFLTTWYNARITRWNINCAADNAAGDCGGEL